MLKAKRLQSQAEIREYLSVGKYTLETEIDAALAELFFFSTHALAPFSEETLDRVTAMMSVLDDHDTTAPSRNIKTHP